MLAAVVGAGFGVDVRVGTLVPTAVTAVTGARVTCSLERVRLTSTPFLVRTSHVNVLLPSRPAVRTTVLPFASAPSSTLWVVNGTATTSVTVVVTSAAASAVGVSVDVVVADGLGVVGFGLAVGLAVAVATEA